MLPVVAVLVAVGLSGCELSSTEAAPSPTAGQQQGTPTAEETPTSQTSAPPMTDATVDPCSLVSRAEAEQLAGTSLDSPVSVAERCTYTAPPSGPTAQVEIFIGKSAENYLAAERGVGHDLQPLTGIGDEAYIEEYAVFVNNDGLWASIDLVRSNDPADNRGPLEILARKVAERI